MCIYSCISFIHGEHDSNSRLSSSNIDYLNYYYYIDLALFSYHYNATTDTEMENELSHLPLRNRSNS